METLTEVAAAIYSTELLFFQGIPFIGQKIICNLYRFVYCTPSNYHCDKCLGIGFNCKGCVALKALKQECLNVP